MARRLSPQEKKVLSYSKDGRNTVAESRGKAHKAIAIRKAAANRALRRAESIVADDATRDPEHVDVFVARVGRKSWRKIPDSPLAEYVDARLKNRNARGMNKFRKSASLLEEGRAISAARPIVLHGSTGNGRYLIRIFRSPETLQSACRAAVRHTRTAIRPTRTVLRNSRPQMPIRTTEVIVMRGKIRNIAVTGCLALPLSLPGAATEWSTQKEIKVAKKIKKEVANDEALQPSSRNIDVTIRNGVVTLKGMVRSETESQEILGKAESEVTQETHSELINAALFRFDNQLEVASQ